MKRRMVFRIEFEVEYTDAGTVTIPDNSELLSGKGVKIKRTKTTDEFTEDCFSMGYTSLGVLSSDASGEHYMAHSNPFSVISLLAWTGVEKGTPEHKLFLSGLVELLQMIQGDEDESGS